MKTRTTVRSWPAMAIAALFLGGTCFVLFQDILHGAPVTAGHVFTGLAIVATAAAGHSAIPTLHDGRPLLALGLGLLAAAGLVYVATMSAARNAEVSNTKAERIVAINAERARILPQRTRAQAMLDEANADLARECKSGKGKRCDGIQATIEVYTAAIKGHDADMRRLGLPETPNAGYKAAAEAMSLLPWVTAPATDIERRLVVLIPWLAVLIAEFGLIMFLSLSLGHSPARSSVANDNRSPSTRDTAQTSFPVPPPSNGGTPVSIPENHPVIVALNRARRPLTNDELAEALGVHKGTASKWRTEVADHLDEVRDGRFIRVTLKRAV